MAYETYEIPHGYRVVKFPEKENQNDYDIVVKSL